MRLAMLRRPLPGLRHRVAHYLGAAIDQSRYSHSAIVFDSGLSGSAWAKGGVDIRPVGYDLAYWHFYTLPDALEPQVHKHIHRRMCEGVQYDHLACLRFAFPLLRETARRDMCHELIAAGLGFSEAWRYGPGLLVARCKDEFGSVLVDGPLPDSEIHPAVLEAHP